MSHATKHLCYVLILAFGLSACNQPSAENKLASPLAEQASTSNRSIEQAFSAKQSNLQVSGTGVVVKLLADDNKGARHQKFLVKINPQQTLLFAHNIDLAPRVPLQAGDTISFSGEYVYNPKGGVIHWTHHSPKGNHPGGWVMHNNEKYQ